MARLKTLEIGVLNIKIHPHTPEKYVELMEDLFKLASSVAIRGSDYGTTNYVREIITGKPLEGLYGEFYRYLEINEDEPWLDLKERKTILDKNGEPVPQVDGNKKPNAKEVEFVFYPVGHRLFYNSKNFYPTSAQKLLLNLFSNEVIKRKYGNIDVEIESSKEVIERILKIPSLTKLDISFTRPNDDDIGDLETKIFRRIENQNIRKFHQTISSPKEDGIEPDDETVALMHLATSNGQVDAVGYSGEEKIIESTKPHPLLVREKFDPDKITSLRFLMNISSDILRKLRSRS